MRNPPLDRRPLIARASTFLVLGALVNAGLTYGVLLHLDYPWNYSALTQNIEDYPWPEMLPSEADRLVIVWSPSFGTDRSHYLDTSSSAQSLGGGILGRFCQSGWPLRSFEGGYYQKPQSNDIVERGALFLTQNWQRNFWSVEALPWRPLWPGLAINAIFYGVIVGLLFAVPGRVRRWRRVRRGLCPACGYPIGESTLCSECGARVRP